MKISVRVLFLLCFIFITSLITAANTNATETVIGEPQGDYQVSEITNTDTDVPVNITSGTQIIMIEAISALSCQLAGFDPSRPSQKCLGVNPETGKIGFVENGGGLLAVSGRLIDYTFAPPISAKQYVAYAQSNFGITKSAYAQFGGNDTNPCSDPATSPRGVGFCGIEPILKIWVAMRNIAYLILILVFVVIGLGIMLRIHIDPRTVMTIQNQIPKIIIGIVVITFSFAIAGFMIDVMWVAVYLFASVLTSATGSNSGNILSIVQSGNPFDAANASFNFSGNIFNNGILGVAEETSKAFGGLIQSAFEGRGDFGLAGDVFGGLITGLAFIIIVIAMISALLRLWVALVFCYINIILDIIFAPFWILAGILPGSSLGIGAWFRDLLANLAVFPVAIGFFILGNYLVGAIDATGEAALSSRFVPPLMGGQSATGVAALIGFGFVLMLPNVMTTVKAALKAPKLDFGPIFKPVTAGAGFVGAIPKRTFEMGQKRRYFNPEGSSPMDRFYKYFGNPYYNTSHRGGGGGEGTSGHQTSTGQQPQVPGHPKE